jgi:AraC-like DNA-binding protein
MIFNEQNMVRINSLGKVFCKADWIWDLRNRPFKDFDLWFLIEGKGRLTLDGQEYKLHGGDCFMFRPGMTLYADTDQEEPLVVIYTHFEMIDNNGNTVNADTTELPALCRKISDPVFFVNILHRMLDCYYRKDNNGAEKWLTAALLEIVHLDTSDTQLNAFSRISEYIRELYTKINEHPEKDYLLRKLAGKAGYSPEHFSRLFKQHTGTSFRESITRARINQAVYLLSSTEYSIIQIAGIVGYSDIFIFSKLFKKHTGVSPTAYRKNSRSKTH